MVLELIVVGVLSIVAILVTLAVAAFFADLMGSILAGAIPLLAGIITWFLVGPSYIFRKMSGDPEAEVMPMVEATPSLIETLQTETLTMFSVEYILADVMMTFVALIIFGFFVLFAEWEKLWFSLGLLVATLLGMQFLVGIQIGEWVGDNIFTIILLVIMYFLVGAAYTAFVEWREYCRKNSDPDALGKYLLKNAGKTEEDYFSDCRAFHLHPSNHYWFLTNSMLNWPFLLFWRLLHDPIEYLARIMYNLMVNVFWETAVNASKPKTKG